MVGFALHNLEQAQAAQASLLHVYMRDGVPTTDVDVLWDRLARDPRVASVNYVTKAEALARAQRIPGLPHLPAATDGNPFPASLDGRVTTIDDAAAIPRPRPPPPPLYPPAP